MVNRLLDEFVSDIRYAIRQLASSYAFTLFAAATLALAIGGCSSVFSVVNAVLIRRLPYKHPGSSDWCWRRSASTA